MASLDPDQMARRLREARLQARLTQAELAEAAGISNETVSRIERGTFEPAVSTLFALAGALGASLDEIVGLRTPSAPPSERSSLLLTRLVERAPLLDPTALRALLRIVEVLANRRPASALARKTSDDSLLRYRAATAGVSAHEPRSTYGTTSKARSAPGKPPSGRR